MNTNIPKLRFKEFTDEWQEKKIRDIFQFKQGVQIPIDQQSMSKKNKQVKFIRIIDITQQDELPRYINDPGLQYHIGQNDLFMVRYGIPGRVCIGYKGVIANNLFHLLPKENINTKYFYYIFKKLEKSILVLSGSSSMPAISFGTLNNISVDIPQGEEQQKIAEFLTAVDEKISHLENKKSQFEKYKKGAMQAIFPAKAGQAPKVRFRKPGGSNYPDWEEKKLGEIVDFQNGKAHEKDISEDGKYIVVNSKFISSNGNIRKFSDKQLCPVSKNDIVMVMSDIPNGKALAKCFYIDKDNKYTLNQRICSLTAINADNKYLFYLINRNKYYLKFDSGVGQTNLKRNEVLSLNLFIPSKEEQEKIAEFLTSLDNKVDLINKELEQAKLFKKSLLQQMFI